MANSTLRSWRGGESCCVARRGYQQLLHSSPAVKKSIECFNHSRNRPTTGTFVVVSGSQKILEDFVKLQGLTWDPCEVGSCPRRDCFAARGLHVAVAVYNHQVEPDRLLSNSAIRALFRQAMRPSTANPVRAEIEFFRFRLCLGVARCNPA